MVLFLDVSQPLLGEKPITSGDLIQERIQWKGDSPSRGDTVISVCVCSESSTEVQCPFDVTMGDKLQAAGLSVFEL